MTQTTRWLCFTEEKVKIRGVTPIFVMLSYCKGTGGVLCCQEPPPPPRGVPLLDSDYSSHIHLFVNPAPTKQAVVEECVSDMLEWMTLDFCATVKFWISGSRKDIWEGGGRKLKQKQRGIKGSKSNSVRKALPKWKPDERLDSKSQGSGQSKHHMTGPRTPLYLPRGGWSS